MSETGLTTETLSPFDETMGDEAPSPFDVMALDEVRPYVVSRRGAIVFSRELSRIVWANGGGLRLLGAPSLNAIAERFDPRHTLVRQIRPSVERLEEHDEAGAMLRAGIGFRTKLVGFTVRRIDMGQGRDGVLLVSDELQGRGTDEAAVERAAVATFDAGHGAALVDGNGAVRAASGPLSDLAAPLSRIVSEGTGEVEIDGRDHPARAVRLDDSRHLVVLDGARGDSRTEDGDGARAEASGIMNRALSRIRDEREAERDERGEVINAKDVDAVPLSEENRHEIDDDRDEPAAEGRGGERSSDARSYDERTQDERADDEGGSPSGLAATAGAAFGAVAGTVAGVGAALSSGGEEASNAAVEPEEPRDDSDERPTAKEVAAKERSSRRWFYRSRRGADPVGEAPSNRNESVEDESVEDDTGGHVDAGSDAAEAFPPHVDEQTGGDRIEGSGAVFVPNDASGGRTSERDAGSVGDRSDTDDTDVTADMDGASPRAPEAETMPVLDRDMSEVADADEGADEDGHTSASPGRDGSGTAVEMREAGAGSDGSGEATSERGGEEASRFVSDPQSGRDDEGDGDGGSEGDDTSEDAPRRSVGFLGRTAGAIGSAIGAAGLVRTVRHSEDRADRDAGGERSERDEGDERSEESSIERELALNEAEGGADPSGPDGLDDKAPDPRDLEADRRDAEEQRDAEERRAAERTDVERAEAERDGATSPDEADIEGSSRALGFVGTPANTDENIDESGNGAAEPFEAPEEDESEELSRLDGAMPGADGRASADDADDDVFAADADASEDADVESDEADETPAGFAFAAHARPTRFVWSVDEERRFTSVSAPLAEAVGPAFADLEGRRWEDVAEDFGFDDDGAVRRLLDRGDTWSGRTVMWPVQSDGSGHLRVPVDLAGLPAFDANRRFVGFNGFGIARTADAIPDTDPPEPPEGRDDTETDEHDDGGDEGADVVDLGAQRGKTLSNRERAAFVRISEHLSGRTGGSEEGVRAVGESSDGESEGKAPSGDDAPIPSAFAYAPPAEDPDTLEEPSGTDDTSDAPEDVDASGDASRMKVAEVRDVDTSILARLPIPVLAYRDDTLLFANAEFYRATRFASLHELADAGGVSVLFEGDEIDGELALDRDGAPLDLRAGLQQVPWDRERATLLTLRRDEPDRGSAGGNQPVPGGSGPGGSDGRGDRGRAAMPNVFRPGASVDGPAAWLIGDGSNDGGGDARSQGETPSASIEAEQPFGGLSHADLRNILDTATDGIVVMDASGRIRDMNRPAEALFDVETGTVAGEPLSRLLAPESRRSVEDYIAGLGGTGIASVLNDGREVIARIGPPDAVERGQVPLFMTIGRLSAPESAPHLCAVLRDLTEWKKAEGEFADARAAAERANAHKSEFLAHMSHEIRSPLNTIIGFTELMLEEPFGPVGAERYRDYLRDIRMSGRFMLDMVNDMLDISKVEAGALPLDLTEVALNTVATETVAMARPQASRERVVVRTSLAPDLPTVVADDRTMRQILLNLVVNALNHTEPGGQVIVSTAHDERGEVSLRVRDTGIGMTPDEVRTALEPYGQVRGTRGMGAKAGGRGTGQGSGHGMGHGGRGHGTGHATGQGTGLGLPLTKAMTEANRARFLLSSRPSEGTLVEIRFPPQRVLTH